MSSPPYEATFGYGHEPAVEHPASEGTHASPPPYVQSAPPVYFIQGSPSRINFSTNVRLQKLVPAPAEIQPQNPMTYHETFLKGKPKALGIVIIVTAIVQIILGVVLAFFDQRNLTYASAIMFWGAIIYIIAGVLSIAAHFKSNTCLIRGSLGMNIVTSIISATGMLLSAVDIYYILFLGCYSEHDMTHEEYDHCHKNQKVALAIVSVLIIADVLIFCVSVSTSAFGCRSLKQFPIVQQVFMIQNGTVLTSPSSIQADAFLHPPAYPPGYVTPGGPPK